MKSKLTVLTIIIVLVFLLPVSVEANDGGYSPDYSGMVTYTVETDCEEVGIGETFEFTVTIKNRTEYSFERVELCTFIEDAQMYYFLMFGEYDDRLILHPYETRVIVFEMTVPEHVAWYKVGDDYYFNLKPELRYEVNEDDPLSMQNIHGGWGFINMAGVAAIPIRITNLYDGSDLITLDLVDTNSTVYFYGGRYGYEDVDNMYEGQYDGDINNIIQIENLTDNEFKIMYIDTYNREFFDSDDYYLYANEKIIVDVFSEYYHLPKDIPTNIDVQYHMIFQSASGEYFAVGDEKKCKTKIFNIPNMTVTNVFEEDSTTKVFTNAGSTKIKNLTICYGIDFTMSVEDILALSKTVTLQPGDSVEVPYSDSYRLGYISSGIFTYIEMGNSVEQYNDHGSRIYEYIKHIKRFDLNNMYYNSLAVKNPLLCLHRVIQEKGVSKETKLESSIIHMETPEGTKTPTPTEASSPILNITSNTSATLKPVSTPRTYTVVNDKRYIVNPWILVWLAVAVIILSFFIVFRIKGEL